MTTVQEQLLNCYSVHTLYVWLHEYWCECVLERLGEGGIGDCEGYCLPSVHAATLVSMQAFSKPSSLGFIWRHNTVNEQMLTKFAPTSV